MPTSVNLREAYLNRLDELIIEGNRLSEIIVMSPAKGINDPFPERVGHVCTAKANFRELEKWRTNCVSLLENILPKDSNHSSLIDEVKAVESDNKYSLEVCVARLGGIKDDFEQGFLQDLTIQIEAEIAADYLQQAEQLIAEGKPGKYDHVPAAVLSGATLEKELRTLCLKQSLPVRDSQGTPVKMNRLIDDLKKAGVYTELKAKQLRAWADIRNKAAHGEFDQFNRQDVETMLSGIQNFLADYLA